MTFAARRSLLHRLVDAGFDFVLIGGMAVIAHGHVRATKDVDVIFETSPENCERFAAVLERLGAEIVVADTLPADGRITSEWLAEGGHLVFATEAGQLDAMPSVSGLDYAKLASRAIEIELAGGRIALACSYEHLVALKEAAGRQQDIADLEALRAIRERAD